MVERKQEKKRRKAGCNLMRDLCITQRSGIVTSVLFFKHFILLSRDSNFNYRTEMAIAISNLIMHSDKENYKSAQKFAGFGITKQEFQDAF